MKLTVPSYYSVTQPVVSQSLFEQYMLCHYRFLFNLNLYTDPEIIQKTIAGTFGHDILDYVRKTGKSVNKFIDSYKFPKEIKADYQEYMRTVMSVLISNYLQVYPDYLKCSMVTEEEFSVMLGQNRMIGKMDGVVTRKKNDLWLLERKFKGNISEDAIEGKLRIDWQTLFYLVALHLKTGKFPKGVIYDVIRFPKRSTKQGLAVFAETLEKDVMSRPDYFYYRWETEFSENDIIEFKEELCEKFNDLSNRKVFYRNQCACQAPFPCSFIEACASGSFDGLKKKTKLFEELANEFGKGKAITGKSYKITPVVLRKQSVSSTLHTV